MALLVVWSGYGWWIWWQGLLKYRHTAEFFSRSVVEIAKSIETTKCLSRNCTRSILFVIHRCYFLPVHITTLYHNTISKVLCTEPPLVERLRANGVRHALWCDVQFSVCYRTAWKSIWGLGSEFQVAGPTVAELIDTCRTSWERGTMMTTNCLWHMSTQYDGAARRRHLLTSVHSLNRIRWRTGSQSMGDIRTL